MPPLWLDLTFVVAVIASFWYLTECSLFGHQFETKHPEAWQRAGGPSIWNTRAQQPLLMFILGFAKLEPAQADLMPQLQRMRLLLAAGAIPMMVVFVYCFVAKA
jgi:hypothetical protein